MTILRRCPFCGGEVTMVYSERKVHDIRIMCSRCGIGTGWWTCEPDVLERVWNTRAVEDQPQEVVAIDDGCRFCKTTSQRRGLL